MAMAQLEVNGNIHQFYPYNMTLNEILKPPFQKLFIKQHGYSAFLQLCYHCVIGDPYELTNEPTNGYNSPDFKQTDGTNTTYLVGPGAPIPPDPPTPTPPDPPTPPDNRVNPPTDDNVRVRNIVPEDPMKPLVNTPVAYAADMDEDEAAPCRKNVDGSVTVVRAYPMVN